MKEQLTLAFGLLGAFFGCEGQKPDTAWLIAHYRFTHVRDTADRAHPYTENTVLFVGKSASIYGSYDRLIADKQVEKAPAGALASSMDGHTISDQRGAGSRTQYYQYPREQKLFIKDNLMSNDYLIQGPMPAVDWKISGDTSTFGGLHCQKATGHFKGRDFIVWFCPDLPVHSGPWKLNGLPGVIVDARDTKNEVVFKFDGVEKTIPPPPKSQSIAGNTNEKHLPPILRGLNDDPNLIKPPAKAIKITQKEFNKLRAAIEKDPAAFAQALNTANSRGDGAGMDHIIVDQGHTGPVINNPIELPEK